VRYHDSDCIVRLFCEQKGRMTSFFKRGLINRKGISAVQAHVFSKVGFLEHPHKMATMVSCDSEPECLLPTPLKVFCFRSYISEIIEKLLPESDPAPEIFALTKDCYHCLIRNGPHAVTLRAFELKLLRFLGYMPELPKDTEVSSFAPKDQKFIHLGSSDLIFSPEAIRLARLMLIAKIGTISYEGQDLALIGRIFSTRLKMLGLWPLKSVSFFKQVKASFS
jgi:DNA repair protein RecO